MKNSSPRATSGLAAAIFGLLAALLPPCLFAQQEGWQIVRADYGFRNQRNDVTDLLKDLIERGGVNGKLVVSNQTMGGDPATGADKNLRIFARSRTVDGSFVEREFDYREGSFVETRQFMARRMNPSDHQPVFSDRDREREKDRDRDRAREGDPARGPDADDWNGIRILKAFYGVQGKTVNVTELLRNRLRDGKANIVVTNAALGGDPAVGEDKVLIVIYSYQGRETAVAVREGEMLSLP